MKPFEADLRRAGYTAVAGVDEAGRGPLAGPVVAAAVILRPGGRGLRGIADSKALGVTDRERFFERIMAQALAVGIGAAGTAEIETHNILQASRLAMRTALSALRPAPDFALVDGLPVPGLDLPHRAIVGGDACCASIAAASIVAKVTRDRLMRALDATYRGYGFARHKGYATTAHLRALIALGPSAAHRAGFAPIADRVLPWLQMPATSSTQVCPQVCISD